MILIRITNETMDAIRNSAVGNSFHPNGTRQPDGTWLVPVADETAASIEAERLEGETTSDCILRVIAYAAGRRQ